MDIYIYKGRIFFTLEECIRFLPKVKLFNIKIIPDNILRQLGISKRYIDGDDVQKLIEEQKTAITKYIKFLRHKYEQQLQPGYPIEQLDFDNIKAYIWYLENYSKKENWWMSYPKELHEWTYDDEGLYE